MNRLLALLLVAALSFQASTAFSEDDVNRINDPFLKLLTKYVVDFPNKALTAWETFSVRLLRMTDVGDSLNAYAEQIRNPGASGTCVDQLKHDYSFLKSSALQVFQKCAVANPLLPDAFNNDIDSAIKDLTSVDNEIQNIVKQCDTKGQTRDQCEAANKYQFMALRIQSRTKTVKPLYDMAFGKIMTIGKELGNCIEDNTADLIHQIGKNVQLFYQCLKEMKNE